MIETESDWLNQSYGATRPAGSVAPSPAGPAVLAVLALLASFSLASFSLAAVPLVAGDVPGLLRDAGIQPIEPASPAIDLDLPEVRGGRLAFSSSSGNWLLLTFWATWCQPCVAELPSLDRLDAMLDERGAAVTLLTVSIDDQREPVIEFLDRLGVGLTVLWDEDKQAARAYRASSIPLSYLIDPTGRIVGLSRGARDWSQEVGLFAALEATSDETALGGFGELAWDSESESISLPIRLTPPTARVSVSDPEPRLGSTFYLDVAVDWAGDFEEYLLRTPKVAVPEGIEQIDVSARTSSDMGRSAVTYRFELAAREAGRFALDPVELRYVPRFEDEPVSTLVDGPEVEIGNSSTRWGALVLGLSAFSLAALALGIWWRRRQEIAAQPTAPDPSAELVARLEAAKKHRFEGQPVRVVAELHAAAKGLLARAEEGSRASLAERSLAVERELAGWLERCRFGGETPPTEDLDRLRRHLGRLVEELISGSPAAAAVDPQSAIPPNSPAPPSRAVEEPASRSGPAEVD